MMSCQKIVTSLLFFQFMANLKQSGNGILDTVCKTYIFINSNLLSYKNWKQNSKISNTALALTLWVKILFSPKNTDFLQKMLTSEKLREPWYWKVCFLHMSVYLRAKFQVFSTILTTFRRGNSPHPEQIKNSCIIRTQDILRTLSI